MCGIFAEGAFNGGHQEKIGHLPCQAELRVNTSVDGVFIEHIEVEMGSI